jgi:protocatechuate 3,4-dioxygenase beta subunit
MACVITSRRWHGSVLADWYGGRLQPGRWAGWAIAGGHSQAPLATTHLHFKIEAPGYDTLITHVFRKDDPYLASDAVFGVPESLVTDWLQLADGSYQLDFDFVLNRV